MSIALYLDQYLDSIESLPTDLQHNFNLMHTLDQRCQDGLSEVDKLSFNYLTNVRQLPKNKRKRCLENIRKLFEKCHEYSDDKINLANQTYELVDKHIRRLDCDLARFETELKSQGERLGSDGSISRKRGATEADEPNSSKKKKTIAKTEPKKESTLPAPGLPILQQLAGETGLTDMPVDPNEPTYCVCHQVSYGEMVGCDNNDCPIEWFHFACVGLTSKPKGTWICPRCREFKKK